MKRILFLILGYYLAFQAAIGTLSACGRPESAAIILVISGLCGWGGYKLIQKARALKLAHSTNRDTMPRENEQHMTTVTKTQIEAAIQQAMAQQNAKYGHSPDVCDYDLLFDTDCRLVTVHITFSTGDVIGLPVKCTVDKDERELGTRTFQDWFKLMQPYFDIHFVPDVGIVSGNYFHEVLTKTGCPRCGAQPHPGYELLCCCPIDTKP